MPKAIGTGTCPFCGKQDVELTREHVFPESWYPDGTPQALMVVVPACWPCNQRHAAIESRLFLPLVMQLDDPRVAGAQDATYDAVMPQEPAPWALAAVRDPQYVIAELATTQGAIVRGGLTARSLDELPTGGLRLGQ